ncbi:MAG: pknB 18, partial [Acidobacteria bacterium]|nr:pknB 18 [Acidobacteriota bacterium]
SAILHQEPKPVSGIAPTIPADLEKLINRCLRKDPARRFQYMADVKVALEELKEDSDSGRLQATPAKAKQFKLRQLLVGVAAIVAAIALAVGGWYWLGRQRSVEPEADLRSVPLTSYPGQEETPSFSPDGNSVAFQWCKGGAWSPGAAGGADCDIYVKQIGFEPPSQLTTDPAQEFSPAWSPDGQFIAYLRGLSSSDAALLVKPRTGGQERVLVESGVAMAFGDVVLPYVAWTPDSKWLVFPYAEPGKSGGGLYLFSLETMEKRKLTDGRDASPAFSPDGRSLVFTRWRGWRSETCLLRLGPNFVPQGAPETVAATGERFSWAAAWAPDGSEIVFSSGAHTSGSLWRAAASASAKPHRLAVAADRVGSLAVSRQGSRLAYVLPMSKTSVWRVDLRGLSITPTAASQFISSTRREFDPAYSPDGRRISFMSDRSGSFEIWACDSDGSNAVQLTSFGEFARGSRWSADGRSLVFEAAAGGNHDIYVMGANGGAPRRLTTDPAFDKFPCWSRDGQSVYFVSNRSGSYEIWKMPVAGGEAVQISRNQGDLPQESPDGRSLYYMKGQPYPEECSVWRMLAGGGEETRVIDSFQCDGGWHVGEQGVYFFAKPDEKGRSELQLHEFATGKTRKILTVERPVMGITASPDGRTILWTQSDQAGSDLMLVENFR